MRSAELGSIEALGLPVIRSIPSERGFNQPCPLWKGQCTIYHSPHYPRFCRTYKCKLLKKLLEESTSLSQALSVVKGAKELIQEVEVLLPDSPNPNFRERLVAQLAQEEAVERAAMAGVEHLERGDVAAHPGQHQQVVIGVRARIHRRQVTGWRRVREAVDGAAIVPRRGAAGVAQGFRDGTGQDRRGGESQFHVG